MLIVHKKEEEKAIEIKLGDLFEDSDGLYYILSTGTFYTEDSFALVELNGGRFWESYMSMQDVANGISYDIKHKRLKHYSSDRYELRLVEMERN